MENQIYNLVLVPQLHFFVSKMNQIKFNCDVASDTIFLNQGIHIFIVTYDINQIPSVYQTYLTNKMITFTLDVINQDLTIKVISVQNNNIQSFQSNYNFFSNTIVSDILLSVSTSFNYSNTVWRHPIYSNNHKFFYCQKNKFKFKWKKMWMWIQKKSENNQEKKWK